MKVKGNIVLASSSPRRRQILENIGLKFDVAAPQIDEAIGDVELPADYVSRMAKEKALFALKGIKNPKETWVISADTIVVSGGKILQKPRDDKAAKDMLKSLSAKTHKVLSSYYIAGDGGKRCRHCTVETFVTFRNISDKEIEWYVGTGEPMDKAGGYGVQEKGALFIDRIEGSYNNVVGLPISSLIKDLIFLNAIEF
jgi:septum formation protein